MTIRNEVGTAVRVALQHFGQIDVWVNNAGVGITRQPSLLTDEDVFQMMRSNVLSALYGMQEILPHFKARGNGHIINVSSILGRIPYAVHRAAYNGAKHFLNALTANFRDEVQATHPGIFVTLVSPGGVNTEFGSNALHGGPLSSSLVDAQSPHEVALVLASLVQNPRNDVYSADGMRDRVLEYYAATGMDP
jgi:NADP-dependent 3-hydroxy acid dehydrogenase YdfG